MNEFKRTYSNKAQLEIGKVRREIDKKKEEFKSTDWTDHKIMMDAANEIWRLEKRLENVLEIHGFIMENLRD